MDQTADEAKYSCHLYSNPCCPLICPVVALAFYFSFCCNLPQNGQSWLFPGHDQYQWFLEMLSCLIWDHKAEVSELGVNPKMCDLKFLMLYITDKVVAAGRLVDVITMASVVVMFSVVATEFGGARNSQKKWLTIVQEIQRRP